MANWGRVERVVMPYYRLCLFDDLHRVKMAEHLTAPDDRSALEMANALKRSERFEVWTVDRFVGETARHRA